MGTDIVFADIPGGRVEAADVLAMLAAKHDLRVAPTLDAALEASEDVLLDELSQPYDFTSFSLSRIPLFAGLDRSELPAVEAIIQPIQFSEGDKIIASGDDGDSMLIVARGTVSVWVGRDERTKVRVGGMGPGQFFGELAALGGGIRSADVIADERVVCYVLSAAEISALGQSHPQILVKILGNMAREFGDRLRQSNSLISGLK